MFSFAPAPLTIVVLSLLMVTFSAVPNKSMVALSNLMPFSSEITIPPVRIAMSSNISLRRSPNPGALTAATFKAPLKRLTTRVVNASPSISSAMINKGRPDCAVASKIGRISFKEEIFLSWIKMYGFSNSTSIFSVFVTK